MIDLAIINLFRQNGDVSYSRYTAPIGDIYILGNDTTLKALIFKNSYPGFTAINKHFDKGAPDGISKTIIVLDDYFSDSGCKGKTGNLRPIVKSAIADQVLQVTMNTTVLMLDLSHFTQKQIDVYCELLKVPPGATISYGHLADSAGIPGGARFVGNTMAKNHFPIIIPCHRVIKSDESMGNYSGGIKIKKYLLDYEQK